MANLKIKGYEFNAFIAKDSFDRRAILFRNNILEYLGKLGLTEDDIDIKMEAVAFKRAPASASWYIDGYNLYYSYNGANKFVDNLFVVSKIIQLEVEALLRGEKSGEDFIRDFSEEHDVQERRKQAREILGVDHDSRDMELINKKYKELAKEHHPDMPNGNLEKFKLINNAHKTLKRELE